MKQWICCFTLLCFPLGCIRGGVVEKDAGAAELPADAGLEDASMPLDAAEPADAALADVGPSTPDGGDDAGLSVEDAGPTDSGNVSPADAGEQPEDAGDIGDDGGDGSTDAGINDGGAVGDAGDDDDVDAGLADGGPGTIDAGGPGYCEGFPASLQVQILPQNANTTDDLTLQIRSDDGCEYEYRIEWARNDFIQAGLENELLVPSIQTTRDDTWTATVYVIDELDAESTGFSAARTIGNAPPSVTVSLPASPTVDNNLQTSLEPFDPDGDNVNYTIRWTRDNVPYAPGNDEQAIPALQLRPNDVWRVVVTPDDGWIGGTPGTAESSIVDRPPTIREVSIGPASPDARTPIEATAFASDPDGTLTEIVWEWSISGTPVADEASATLQPGAYRKNDEIIAVATAISGALSSAPMSTNRLRVVNTPPLVSDVVLTPVGFTSADSIRCEVGIAEDPDGDDVNLSYQWVRNPSTTPVLMSEAGPELLAGSVSRGQEIACRVTPDDGYIAGQTVEAKAAARNSPPSLASVSIEPSIPPPMSTDELSCIPSGLVNLEADTITYTTVWRRYIQGVVAGVYETEKLAPGTAQSGDEVTCSMTPNDGFDSGTTVTSAPIIIQNAPPSLTSASILPASPSSADRLSCEAEGAVDTDNDPVTMTYAWYQAQTGLPPLLLSESRYLAPGSVNRYDRVFCEATPTDGIAPGIAVNSTEVVIQNATPTLDRVDLTPAFANVTTTFSCNPVGLADYDQEDVPNLDVETRWIVDDVSIGTSLPPAYVRKGKKIQCALKPFDGISRGDEVLSPVVTVQDSAGSMAAPTITPYEAGVQPRSEQTLTCTPGEVSDPDPEDTVTGYAIRWLLANGVEVGTGSELSTDNHARGQEIRCEVTALFADAALPLVQAISESVEILNTLPTIDSVDISPSNPSAADALSCDPQGAYDADGDVPAIDYVWYEAPNGQSPSILATTRVLPAGTVTRTDRVYCQATPKDAQGEGVGVPSVTITIQNEPPTLERADISPTIATVGSSMTCSAYGINDIDVGDLSAVFTETKWVVNGEPVGATLLTSHMRKGNRIQCAMTPNDGYDAGEEVLSLPVTIQDTPGSLTGTHVTPSNGSTEPRSDQTLVCEPGTLIDPDVEDVPTGYTYRWMLANGAVVGTGPSLSPDYHARGDQIRCEATVLFDDATLPEVKTESSSVQIYNGKPSVYSIGILPEYPDALSTLSSTDLVASDPDGDSITVNYTWAYRDGGTISSYANQTPADSVSLSPTDSSSGAQRYVKGDWIDLQITVSDGSLTSDLYVKSTRIGNTAPAPVQARMYATDRNCWIDLTGSDPSCKPIRHADELLCAPPADAPTTDLDGDAVTYIAEWSMDGIEYMTKEYGPDGYPYGTTNTVGDTQHRHYASVGSTSYCRIMSMDDDTSPRSASGDPISVMWEDGPWLINVNATADAPQDPTSAASLKCEDTNGSCSLRAAMTLARSVSSTSDPLGVRIYLQPGARYRIDEPPSTNDWNDPDKGTIDAIGPFELYGDMSDPPTIVPTSGGFRMSASAGDHWEAVFKYVHFDCSLATGGGPDTILNVDSALDVSLEQVDFTDCETAIRVNGGYIDADTVSIDGDNGKGYNAVRLEEGSNGSLRYLSVQRRGNQGNPGASSLYVRKPSLVTLVEPYFNDNVASYGAHIWFDATTLDEKLRIESGSLMAGWVPYYGGAIYIPGTGTLELVDTLVSGNYAKYGGGLYAGNNAKIPSLLLDGAVFQSNRAYEGYGGGLYLKSVKAMLKSAVIGAPMGESCTNGAGNIAYAKKGVSGYQNNVQGGGMYAERVEMEVMLDESNAPYTNYMRCNQSASNYSNSQSYGAGIYYVKAGQTDENFDPALTTPLTSEGDMREGFGIYQNEKCEVEYPTSTTTQILGCAPQNVNDVTTVCGNGYVEGSEVCDDGNRVNGDSCSNTCGI